MSRLIFHEDTEEVVWENASENVSAEQRDKEHTPGVRQAWLRAATWRITSCVILAKIITLLKLGSHPDVGPALRIPALSHALGVFPGDAEWR